MIYVFSVINLHQQDAEDDVEDDQEDVHGVLGGPEAAMARGARRGGMRRHQLVPSAAGGKGGSGEPRVRTPTLRTR